MKSSHSFAWMETMKMIQMTLQGRPITKKNHCQIVINQKTRRPMLLQSKQYREYEKDCLKQIKMRYSEFHNSYEKGVQLHATFSFYLPNRMGRPDLVNLIQAVQDILQKAEIYVDDFQIKSLDGSRICGIDKDNPRVEIEIEEI